MRNLVYAASYTLCVTASAVAGGQHQLQHPGHGGLCQPAMAGDGGVGFSAGLANEPSMAFAPEGTPHVQRQWQQSHGGALGWPAPVLTAVSPASGSHLLGASAVQFGGTAATAFSVDSAGQITATAPAHVAGAVDITVTTAGAIVVLAGGYTYVEPTAHAITATAQHGAGGSFTCTPSNVGEGTNAACTAMANAGYVFQK